jgi:hypothetical protein
VATLFIKIETQTLCYCFAHLPTHHYFSSLTEEFFEKMAPPPPAGEEKVGEFWS